MTNHYPDPQDWAMAFVRNNHRQALAAFGEYNFYVLKWRIEDHVAGRVDRCHRCFVAHGAIAEAFGQTSDTKCPACFGTTFDGGYRAKIVRETIWDFTEADETPSKRGVVTRQSASIQTTGDFRVTHGDWVVRADGSRWEIKGLGRTLVRTGFEHPTREGNMMGLSFPSVSLEDETMPCYLVPLGSNAEIAETLNPVKPRWAVDFAAHEDIRADLFV